VPRFSMQYFSPRASDSNFEKKGKGRAETSRAVNSSAKTDGLNCISGKVSGWCATMSATRVPFTSRICENLEVGISAAIPDFPKTLPPPFTTLLMTLVWRTTSSVLQGTGNLAVVMRAMGHGSPSTAMKYQNPELEQVRRVLNGTNSRLDSGEASNGTFYGTVTKQ
jgi:hypothetical protein